MLFVDNINRENNLQYCERLCATNLPLPPYGACDLGSLNLPAFVRTPFSAAAAMDEEALAAVAAVAVVFWTMFSMSLDILYRSSATGLAGALIMLGLRYDGADAREKAASILRCIRDAAYQSSIDIASSKGVFPAFDKERFLASRFVGRLPATLRDAIARHGIRNGQLIALAPAGSISLLAGNVSSGIEPVFAFERTRRMRTDDGWEYHATVPGAVGASSTAQAH